MWTSIYSMQNNKKTLHINFFILHGVWKFHIEFKFKQTFQWISQICKRA